jgi:hypothetical protein
VLAAIAEVIEESVVVPPDNRNLPVPSLILVSSADRHDGGSMKTTWDTRGNVPSVMRSPKNLIRPGLSVVTATLALLGASISPAAANDDDVVRRGGCSGSADWKLKVSPDDGRLEVEGEVDSNRNGQTWRWRIVHNGNVSAHGVRTTQPPSGSFEVRRLLVNARGVDTITWRARDTHSGQTCRGSLRF